MCFYFGFFLYWLFISIKCGHQKVASKISMTRLCFHPTQMDSSREYEMIAWFWGLVSDSLSSVIYAFLLFYSSKVNMYHVDLNYHRIRLLNCHDPNKIVRNNELLLGLSKVFVTSNCMVINIFVLRIPTCPGIPGNLETCFPDMKDRISFKQWMFSSKLLTVFQPLCRVN